MHQHVSHRLSRVWRLLLTVANFLKSIRFFEVRCPSVSFLFGESSSLNDEPSFSSLSLNAVRRSRYCRVLINNSIVILKRGEGEQPTTRRVPKEFRRIGNFNILSVETHQG
jgi:hypothetical protein